MAPSLMVLDYHSITLKSLGSMKKSQIGPEIASGHLTFLDMPPLMWWAPSSRMIIEASAY